MCAYFDNAKRWGLFIFKFSIARRRFIVPVKNTRGPPFIMKISLRSFRGCTQNAIKLNVVGHLLPRVLKPPPPPLPSMLFILRNLIVSETFPRRCTPDTIVRCTVCIYYTHIYLVYIVLSARAYKTKNARVMGGEVFSNTCFLLPEPVHRRRSFSEQAESFSLSRRIIDAILL